MKVSETEEKIFENGIVYEDGAVFDSDTRLWYWLDVVDNRLYVMVKREGYGKVAEPYKKVDLIF